MANEHHSDGFQCPLNNRAGWDLMMEKIDRIEAGVHETNKILKVQNGRIRKLENWRWYIIGIATAITVLVRKLFT